MRQPPTKRRPALPRAFFWPRRSRAFRPPIFQTAPALPFFTACRAACRVEIARCVCICVFCRHRPRAVKHIHPTNPTNKGHPLMRYYRSAGCFFQDGACRKSSLHVQSSPSSSRSSRNVFFTRMHALLYVPPAMAKNSNTAKGRIKRNGASFA